jgi:hypothetical protein
VTDTVYYRQYENILETSIAIDSSDNVHISYYDDWFKNLRYANNIPLVFALAVNKTGTGHGRVTSYPPGIDCGNDCNEDYLEGTQVTLTAVSKPGSIFVGWGGQYDCFDGVVTMDADKNCTATFNLVPVDPAPDIKANGFDGPVIIKPSEKLTLTVELDPGDKAGDYADWWLLGDTAFGWHYYHTSSGWLTGFKTTFKGRLQYLPKFEVMNMNLPVGKYTFYFGVDTNMNGSIDMGQLYYDSVDVIINP